MELRIARIQVITDYERARAGSTAFLNAPRNVCLLAGHTLEAGQEIAVCAICQTEGCVDCLDSHDCTDYERIM